MAAHTVPTIIIIGAGFCGTMTAVHLLRSNSTLAFHLVLVDPNVAGRGLAYGTTDLKHLLNVPAGGMSAFENEPADFLNYLKGQFGTASSNDFLPRHVYGDYLQQRLHEAVATKSDSVHFSHIHARALDIRAGTTNASGSGQHHDTHWHVLLSNGTEIRADKIILATGNAQPKTPTVLTSSFIENSSRCINDPWCEDLLERIDWRQPLLLIGSGLTAVDVILKLAGYGYKPAIYAISRHGLSPIAHRGLSGKLAALDLPQLQTLTIAQIVRLLREKVAETEIEGRDWRDIIAALRPHLPQLWQQLPQTQRERFMRHCVAYWDVHRHRLAPPVAASLHDLLSARRLTIHAGRLLTLSDNGAGLDVQLRLRGDHKPMKLAVGNVINCTGPNADVLRSGDELLNALLQRGLIKPDALGLGIEVEDDYTTVSSHSSKAQSIFYVGPWLKAKLWEATAVPELRVHAHNVASNVLTTLANEIVDISNFEKIT